MFKIVDGVRVNLSAEEIVVHNELLAAEAARLPDNMRSVRNGMLEDCDWTHTSDHDNGLTAEKKTEWATYRQALRDAPNHEEWPNMEAHWPTQPE
jgi:hypothetical protein